MISPEKIWFPAFLGLAYPYFLLINVMFMLGWLLLRKKEFLISLITIILGWSTFSNYLSMHPFRLLKKEYYENLAREQRATSQQLKLVSFNVHGFQSFYRKDHSSSRKEILAFLRDEDPDMLCLQEFYSFNLPGYRESDFYDKLNHLPFRHIDYVDSRHATGLGIASFSRYPILSTGRIPLEKSNNICIYSNILVDQDTFRIYNCHLQSVNLDSEDYHILDSLKFRYDDQQIAEIKDISNRLRYAFIKRAAQANLVAAHVAACPYPAIICGDFNDTPVSYTYRTIRNGLQDAFSECGWGLGRTYHGEFPSFRIDYTLHSKSMETLFYSRGKITVSDHFPIISYLKMKIE